MTRLLHAFDVIEEKCKAKLACMRICPTFAIRVRDGTAKVNPQFCIDCGDCIAVCQEGAIKAKTDPWKDIDNFNFKVAIPSPTLFGQFPMDVTSSDIMDGLLSLGFDAVYEISLESELINKAIMDYLEDYKGPYPLISSACPAVVRLVQVAYPDMVDQIIPIDPPRELASREMKKLYTKAKGLSEDEIGAIYLTPCPAQVVSIKQPAEGVESYLDLGISISDVYNPLLAAITKMGRVVDPVSDGHMDSTLQSTISLAWTFRGGQCQSLKPSRYISVTQMSNIMRLFDDIEMGKIRGVEFVECYACTGGCLGGPLLIDDMFVSRSKLQKIIELKGDAPKYVKDEVTRRYTKGDYFIRQPLKPRPIEQKNISIEDKIKCVKIREDLARTLPGVDCGLCGAPTCLSFADDVANGESSTEDCVLLPGDRAKTLREQYMN